ncbi:MAG: 50S ribosomal protein L15 [Gemmatimonadota bacterium]
MTKKLNDLPAPQGATQARKRKGRGPGSGLGKTAGRGHKGHKARAGGTTPPGFEGGQMPLQRRLPKRGFHNPFRVEYEIVNVRDLGRVHGEEANPETLRAAGLIRGGDRPVKVLGAGELARDLVVRAHAFSASAREKIEKAGGRAEGIA